MPTPAKYTVALVQMACSPDPDENLRRALAFIAEAARMGAHVVCLPELFRSQYFCQREDVANFELAETIPGPTSEALARAARNSNVVLLASLFEKRAAGIYHNTTIVFDNTGDLLGLYRKMHIPDDPAYYEKFYFTPGDLGFRVFETQVGPIAPLICWDQWYPEAARLAALRGSNVLFYPTAIGWHPAEKAQYGEVQRDAWRTVQRGHAIANGLYVAAVNRVGHEVPPGGAGIEFWGSSFICDPQGVVLAEASCDREQILTAEIDCARIEDVRRNWPFLRDRRIDAYSGLDRRFLDSDPDDRKRR